jgi:N-acetyl-gamma-glutamyl-phosphate reductase
MKVAIVGVSGYTGKELLSILHKHANVTEIKLYGQQSVGHTVWDIFPEFDHMIPNQHILPINEITYDDDIYFLAMPHGQSIDIVDDLLKKNKKIIDLSADYRLDDPKLAKEIYQLSYKNDRILENKIYGLTEIETKKKSNLIANPGCYPTATLLSLYPLIKNFSSFIENISTVAYSGTSGAGKKADQNLLLSEMESNVKAYNVLKHRHEPEIKQELKKYSDIEIPFVITMHLLPIKRGIYTSTSIFLNEKIEFDSLFKAYENAYKDKHFIRLRTEPVELKHVLLSNFCDISLNLRNNVLVINSCIDNLIKGASGQAVQNMNRLFGFHETTGLI